jgi:DNA-3-methyladenine glycosylase II
MTAPTAAPVPVRWTAAEQHLGTVDPVLGVLIARVGPCGLVPDPPESLFAALLRSIVYQQLHGRAASAILGRVLALFPRRRPTPARLAALPDGPLRAAGLSAAKLASLRDLAAHARRGQLPSPAAAAELDDDTLVQRLTVVRGIGPWTVHMLLIFRLGRPDVLPTGDFAIRSAFRRLYRKRRDPTPAAMERHARIWRPWRSVASWYLWRSLELPAASGD